MISIFINKFHSTLSLSLITITTALLPLNSNANTIAKAVESGTITCFEEDLCYEDDTPVPAGLSAAVFDGNQIYIGIDKPLPLMMRSSLFSLDYPPTSGKLETENLHFHSQKPFKNATKYESATLTPNGKHVILATAFGPIGHNVSPQAHPYCTILCFPSGEPEKVTVANPTTVDGYTSSISLRPKMLAVLRTEEHPHGVPYFSIEGLAAIPGNRLLFGIRQVGKSYTDYQDVTLIMSVPYQIINDELHIDGDKFEVVYNYNLSKNPEIQGNIGISSLEYDKYNNRLYLLTSYENTHSGYGTDQDVHTYLWTLSLDDFYLQKMPTLVRNEHNQPFTFPHKMEGLAVLDKNHILVVADDDYILGSTSVDDPTTQFSRTHNESSYVILELDN